MSDSTFILIPVHNRRQVTLSCLRSLYGDASIQAWPDLQVVVIDDGSSDGTQAAIEAEFPALKVLQGDGSLWWTGAICRGMEYGYAQGAQTFFWLNDDCPPRPGSLQAMYQIARQRNCLVGAACYLAETGELMPTGAKGRTRIAAQPGEMQPVDEMSGHCVCIPRSVVDAIGLPNVSRFPHYHGDSSYTLTATQAGFEAYILGDAQVTHPGVIKSGLQDFSDARLGLLDSYRQLFWRRKSLYFMPTQFHYHVKKYGPAFGSCVFALKSCWWLARWGWFNLAGTVL